MEFENGLLTVNETYYYAPDINSTYNSTTDDASTNTFNIKWWVLFILILAVLTIIGCLVCFFIPSKNKRKIYGLLQEAKIEAEH